MRYAILISFLLLFTTFVYSEVPRIVVDNPYSVQRYTLLCSSGAIDSSRTITGAVRECEEDKAGGHIARFHAKVVKTANMYFEVISATCPNGKKLDIDNFSAESSAHAVTHVKKILSEGCM